MKKTFRHGLAVAVCTAMASASADAKVCDYRPSKVVGKAGSAASAAVGGGAAAAGLGLKAAGYYTLVHAGSGLTMLGSTAAGGSAAGTVGIIAGTAGAIGTTIAGILMAPVTLVVGAVTFGGVAAYEGVCYFQVERVTDPYAVRDILESVAENDENATIAETGDGLALVLKTEDGQNTYLMKRLYIEEGQLRHRDWALNTNLGPVVFVGPEEAAQ